MNTTYTQKSSTAQKTAYSKAVSLFDSSSQSEALQRKANMANNAAQRAEAPQPNNTGMPDNLKAGIESLSGFSMDDVRVHYNSSKPATVQALAYTQGTDIHVAPGQEKHLPHEAWHVAQQMAGRVSPTTNINGMPVNDNAGLEHEADVMGEKAVQCKGIAEKASFANENIRNSTVQRMAYYTGSASETEQYEGDDATAEIFGWNVKEKKTKDRKRPENVARKVDQYKKEMLTYIASCIHEQGEKNNRDYGPHISVVITRGIWFIAINTDYIKDDCVEQLRKDANIIKSQIIGKWDILSKDSTFIRELKTDDPENVDDVHAKNQALYIVYRWAGKNNGVIVEQNQTREKDDGVIHGEMQTINFLNQEISEKLKKATNLFNISANATAASIVSKAANAARDLEAKFKEKKETDNIESDDDIIATIALYHAAKSAINEAADTAEKIQTDDDAHIIVQEARSIIMYCKEQINEGAEYGRVVRVGGTKTACFDCGYEMNLHNKSERASSSTKNVHKDGTHRAFEIGPKKVVTMTSNCGDGFDNWFYGDDNGGKSLGMCKPDLLQNDFHQNQDYSELHNTFNSIDSIGEKMQITYPTIDMWKQRMNTFKEIKSKNPYNLSCFASLNLENSLQLKSLIEGNLEKVYKLNDTNCIIPKLSNEQKSLGTCLITINEKIDLVNENPINKPFSLNFEEKKGFIYDFIQYERLVVDQLNMNIQKQIATEEYNSLQIDDSPDYVQISNFFSKIKKLLTLCSNIQNIVRPTDKKGAWQNDGGIKKEIDNMLKNDTITKYFGSEDLKKIEEIIGIKRGNAIKDNHKQSLEGVVKNFYENIVIRKAELSRLI